MAPTVTRYPGQVPAYPGQAPLAVPQAASRFGGARNYAPQPQDRSLAPPVIPARSPPRVSRLNDSLNWGTQHLELPIKNTFIEFPHMTPPFTPQKDEKQEVLNGVEQAFCVFHRAATASEGSHLHPHDCKPCAWYHHARGCQRGADCEFCHLCPAGEIKRRKKEKYRMLRESKEQ